MKAVLVSLLLVISCAQSACGMVRTTATFGVATSQVIVPVLYYAIKQRSYYQENQQQVSERVHTPRVDEYDYKYERYIYEHEPCNNFIRGAALGVTPVVNFFLPLVAIHEATKMINSKLDGVSEKIQSENERINSRAFTHGTASGLSLYVTVPLAIYHLKKPKTIQQAVVAFRPKENNLRLVTAVKEICRSKVKKP